MNALWARALAVVFLVAGGATFSACSSGASSPATPPATVASQLAYTLETAASPGPHSVGVTTIDLVDTSRRTDANGTFAGSNERDIKVEVWYPATINVAGGDGRDAPIDITGAPYPLIVFAHGLASNRSQSKTYTRHLASHGYVVVAPDFPLTNTRAPGGPKLNDLINQPRDVSFVIDEMLGFNLQPAHLLHGAIDPSAIGMTGHSLGAFTTLLSVYGGSRDARIKAALPISGSGCFLTQSSVGSVSVPIMDMIGGSDLIIAPSGNRHAYDLENGPKYWVELIGGDHVRFADADVDDEVIVGNLDRLIGNSDTSNTGDAVASCTRRDPPNADPKIKLARQQELLRSFATPFFDAYLKDSSSAKQFLQDQLPELTKDSVRFESEAN